MAILKMNFLSKFLGMPTNITVCLPSFSFRDAVNKNLDFYIPGMKFQTLYLLHGGAGDDSDYVNLTSIVRYADENRIAVVMPADYNHFYTDDREGPRYWRYVSEELPEVCQTLFPLSPAREDNFVAGLSMGGYGAMKMGLCKPERFAAALVMSGAVQSAEKMREFTKFRAPGAGAGDPDVMPMINLARILDIDNLEGGTNDAWGQARRNVEQGKPLPAFYLTVGDKDFALEHVTEAHTYLTALGYETHLDIVPGYGHEWDFWDLSLKKALASWLPLRRDVIYPR
jgi:putative tributyrin esterase